MQVDISMNTKLRSSALISYIMRRIESGFDRFESRIRRLRVRVEDINGPRGGADKQVRLTLSVTPTGTVSVKGVAADTYAAVDQVIERSKHAVARRIAKNRTSAKKKMKETGRPSR